MPTVVANGLALAYEVRGDPDASPLVLVMGLGMPLVLWPDAFVDGLLQHGFRVVCFDNRDCGHSEKLPRGPRPNLPLAIGRALLRLKVRAPYTLDDMAKDVVGLLDALGIARAHLVGVSLGGMIAQVMAVRFPDRVTSLTSIMASSGNPRVSLGKTGRDTRAAAPARRPRRRGRHRPPRRRVRRDRQPGLCNGPGLAARAVRARGASRLLPGGHRAANARAARHRRPPPGSCNGSARRRWSFTAPAIRCCRWPPAATPPGTFRARVCSRSRAWGTTCPRH